MYLSCTVCMTFRHSTLNSGRRYRSDLKNARGGCALHCHSGCWRLVDSWWSRNGRRYSQSSATSFSRNRNVICIYFHSKMTKCRTVPYSFARTLDRKTKYLLLRWENGQTVPMKWGLASYYQRSDQQSPRLSSVCDTTDAKDLHQTIEHPSLWQQYNHDHTLLPTAIVIQTKVDRSRSDRAQSLLSNDQPILYIH